MTASLEMTTSGDSPGGKVTGPFASQSQKASITCQRSVPRSLRGGLMSISSGCERPLTPGLDFGEGRQVNNVHLSEAQIAEQQETLDNRGTKKFNVKKPYISFLDTTTYPA